MTCSGVPRQSDSSLRAGVASCPISSIVNVREASRVPAMVLSPAAVCLMSVSSLPRLLAQVQCSVRVA
jgi:hypothetical protein